MSSVCTLHYVHYNHRDCRIYYYMYNVYIAMGYTLVLLSVYTLTIT